MDNTDNKINIGDAWKDLDNVQINVGDVWKDVEEAYINVGDVWKQWWDAAWLSGWANRIKLTISCDNVGSDLTHYPYPIILNDVFDEVFTEVGTNSKKIAVTKADATTEMYVEIDEWDNTNQTGVLWTSTSGWVISSSANTDIYLYYDNSHADNSSYVDITNSGISSNVWDSSYTSVWHLKENTGTIYDSTSNSNDATGVGDSPTSKDGKLGDGNDFDGAGDYLTAGASSKYLTGANSLISIESWSNSDTIDFGTGDHRIITFHANAATTKMSLAYSGNTAEGQVHSYIGGAYQAFTDTYGIGTWHNLALTYDGTKLYMYGNGAEDTNVTISHDAGGSHNCIIGDYAGSATQRYYNGVIDELRISSVCRNADWINFGCHSQNNETLVFTWLDTWAKRRKITISNTNIDEDLSHYPIPIFLGTSVGTGSDDVSDIFDEVGANSKKIAVTDSNHYQLYVEIDKWDNTTESGILWVSRSSLTVSSGTDTDLYIYYDNTRDDNTDFVNTTSVGVSTNVWDSYYKGVWHLEQTPTGTADQMKDSTSYDNHGTSAGMTGSESVVGKIAKCVDFDGNDDKINCGNDVSIKLNDDITTELWIKPESISGAWDLYYSKTTAASWNVGWGFWSNNDNTMHFYVNQYAVGDATKSLSAGSWQYFVGTYDGSTVKLYKNVESPDTTSYATGYSDSGEALYIGGHGGPYNLNGMADEVRVSNTIRSAAWVKAGYYSQCDNLVSFSAVENYT